MQDRIVSDSYGVTLELFASQLSGDSALGRPVIDRTALTGRFDIHWEYAPANAPAASEEPSIFAPLQEQLGLKVTTTTGPVEVLVIDHIEKPLAN